MRRPWRLSPGARGGMAHDEAASGFDLPLEGVARLLVEEALARDDAEALVWWIGRAAAGDALEPACLSGPGASWFGHLEAFALRHRGVEARVLPWSWVVEAGGGFQASLCPRVGVLAGDPGAPVHGGLWGELASRCSVLVAGWWEELAARGGVPRPPTVLPFELPPARSAALAEFVGELRRR